MICLRSSSIIAEDWSCPCRISHRGLDCDRPGNTGGEPWSSGDWCGAHPCGGGQPDSGEAAWPNPGRYSACGRKFRSRCRERVVALVRGAGHLYYCVSRALSDWRAAGTSVSYFKTVSAIDIVGNPQPSAVLRTHRQARSAQTCLTLPKRASQALTILGLFQRKRICRATCRRGTLSPASQAAGRAPSAARRRTAESRDEIAPSHPSLPKS